MRVAREQAIRDITLDGSLIRFLGTGEVPEDRETAERV